MRKQLVPLALLMAVSLATGCNKKDESPVDSCNLASQKAETYSKALEVYLQTQTKANCENVRRTALDFLNSAENCSSVTPAEIKEARDDVNSIVCQ